MAFSSVRCVPATGGEHGPGDAEGQDAGRGVAGGEDVCKAEAEVEGEFWIGNDVAEAETGGGTGGGLVLFGAIGVQ